MTEYDTIYIFVKEEITGGKAVSQTAHAVGLLASKYPNLWEKHVNNGQRAVALKWTDLPPLFEDFDEYELNEYGHQSNIAYASVFDRTDNDVFALAVLPQKRLNMPQYDIY